MLREWLASDPDDGQNKGKASIKSGLEAGKKQPKGIPDRKVVGIDGKPIESNNVKADGGQPSKAMALTFFDDVENFAKKDWLLKGAVAEGETSEWIAPPGMLKSALLTDLAVHIASGQEWRGYKSKEAAGVVYFALEDPPRPCGSRPAASQPSPGLSQTGQSRAALQRSQHHRERRGIRAATDADLHLANQRRRRRCWIPAAAARKPGSSGPTPPTTGHGAESSLGWEEPIGTTHSSRRR